MARIIEKRRPLRGNAVGALVPAGLGDLERANNKQLNASAAVKNEIKGIVYENNIQHDSLILSDIMSKSQEEYQRRLKEEGPLPSSPEYMKYAKKLQDEVFTPQKGTFYTSQGRTKAVFELNNLKNVYAADALTNNTKAVKQKTQEVYLRGLNSKANLIYDNPDLYDEVVESANLEAIDLGSPELNTKEARINRTNFLRKARIGSLTAKGRFKEADEAIKEASTFMETKEYITLQKDLGRARETQRKTAIKAIKDAKKAKEDAEKENKELKEDQEDIFLSEVKLLVSNYTTNSSIPVKEMRETIKDIDGEIAENKKNPRLKDKLIIQREKLARHINTKVEKQGNAFKTESYRLRNETFNNWELALNQMKETGGVLKHEKELDKIEAQAKEAQELKIVPLTIAEQNKVKGIQNKILNMRLEGYELAEASNKVDEVSKTGFGVSQKEADDAYKYNTTIGARTPEEAALDVASKSGKVPKDITTLLMTAGSRSDNINVNAIALASAARLSKQFTLNRVPHESNEFVILTNAIATSQGIDEEQAAIQVLGQAGNPEIVKAREDFYKSEEGLGKKFRNPQGAEKIVREALGEGWFNTIATTPQLQADFIKFAKSAFLATGNKEQALEIASARVSQTYGESDTFNMTLKHPPERYLDIKHPDLVDSIDNSMLVYTAEELQ